MNNLVLDFRNGVRILTRNRWQSALIVLTLALSISALTSVATVVSAVLLKPYGPVQTDRWVYLWEHPLNGARVRQISVSIPNFLDWKRESSPVFSHVVLWLPWSYTASGAEVTDPQQIRAAVISPEVFEATATAPAAGRFLVPADSQSGEHLAVLSYEFWQRAYGGRSSLIGAKINLNLVPHTVVGIAPPGFCFPPETQTDAWTPLPAAILSSGSRSDRGFRVAARLRPGVSVHAAQASMKLISHRLAQAYPEDQDYDALAVPMREAVAGDFKTPLVALSGALAFALLLACLNIGYLRGVHLESRRKEILLRLALGANRVQLVRQFLVETLLLFGVGGLLGLMISPVATTAMISLVPAAQIPWLHIRTDFATFMAVLTVFVVRTGIRIITGRQGLPNRPGTLARIEWSGNQRVHYEPACAQCRAGCANCPGAGPVMRGRPADSQLSTPPGSGARLRSGTETHADVPGSQVAIRRHPGDRVLSPPHRPGNQPGAWCSPERGGTGPPFRARSTLAAIRHAQRSKGDSRPGQAADGTLHGGDCRLLRSHGYSVEGRPDTE
jgi:putative ABC transport system permease protein